MKANINENRILNVCKRCEYQWFSKKKPIVCAQCKSPYWDKERTIKQKTNYENT